MTEADQEQRSILEFRQATIVANGRSNMSVILGDLKLSSGEMAVVEAEQRRGHPPIAAAAEGLLRKGPGNRSGIHLVGDVLFQGRSWYDGDDRRHLAHRGHIGRVFASEDHGWISNLTVLDNVLLSRLHHTSDPEVKVRGEAQKWAGEIGLDEVPTLHPALVSGWRLCLAQWVRALVIQPTLLVLENPLRMLPESYFDRIHAAINRVRSMGTAVLWVSSGPRPIESIRQMATTCYEINVGKMVRQDR